MVTIMKKLIEVSEDYIGEVKTVKLERKEKGRSYTNDKITVCGVCEEREFELELIIKDETA